MIIDGGLATALEARGCDLNDSLWSARMLRDDPSLIGSVHRDFLEAGADCITSASYQGSFQGFAKRGIDHSESIELLTRASAIAIQTRDEFWNAIDSTTTRLKPIVAGSIGPYGAYLADGSEYTGRYDLDEEGLTEFHRERWNVLAQSGIDLLACETIPSIREARAIRQLMDEMPETWAWVSFSCQNGEQLQDGSLVTAAAEIFQNVPNLAALGINCTAPRFISELLSLLKEMQPLPVIVYPNSGEIFDPHSKGWDDRGTDAAIPSFARTWVKLGAAGVGGCCRVGAEEIIDIRKRILGTDNSR